MFARKPIIVLIIARTRSVSTHKVLLHRMIDWSLFKSLDLSQTIQLVRKLRKSASQLIPTRLWTLSICIPREPIIVPSLIFTLPTSNFTQSRWLFISDWRFISRYLDSSEPLISTHGPVPSNLDRFWIISSWRRSVSTYPILIMSLRNDIPFDSSSHREWWRLSLSGSSHQSSKTCLWLVIAWSWLVLVVG